MCHLFWGRTQESQVKTPNSPSPQPPIRLSGCTRWACVPACTCWLECCPQPRIMHGCAEYNKYSLSLLSWKEDGFLLRIFSLPPRAVVRWMDGCMNTLLLLLLSLYLHFFRHHVIYFPSLLACNWTHLNIPPVMWWWAQWPRGAKASGTVSTRAPEDSDD